MGVLVLDYYTLEKEKTLKRMAEDIKEFAYLVAKKHMEEIEPEGGLLWMSNSNMAEETEYARIPFLRFDSCVRIHPPEKGTERERGNDNIQNFFGKLCHKKNLPALPIETTATRNVASVFSFENGMVVRMGTHLWTGISEIGWFRDSLERMDQYKNGFTGVVPHASYILVPNYILENLDVKSLMTRKLTSPERASLALNLIHKQNNIEEPNR